MLTLFTLLLVCQLAGEILVIATGLPLPGPVIGMLLLFIGLLVRGGIPQGLEKMAGSLLSILSLRFLRAGVGVLRHADLLGREVLPIALSLVFCTLITLIVTGWVMQRLGRRSGDT